MISDLTLELRRLLYQYCVENLSEEHQVEIVSKISNDTISLDQLADILKEINNIYEREPVNIIKFPKQ